MIKNLPSNAGDRSALGSIPGDPLEKEMATHPGFLARKSRGQKSLVGYSPWGHKESEMNETHTHTLCFDHSQCS